MASAEGFTVLAILEARDRASEIFKKVDESLGRFSESAKSAADTAKGAGDSIDESLLKTASGADALDVASARVSAAQARAAETAKVQTAWEKELLSAQKAAAEAADGDAAAQARLSEAGTRLAAATKESTAAQKDLAGAQKLQADTAAAAAAKNDAAATSTAAVSDASKKGGLSLASMGKVAGITALGLGVAGGLMVKAAGNFQDATTHLQTDAGVTRQNLGMVQAGILQVSTATGQSATDITNAMYHIASSGFTAQNGLNILKIAAEGARVGGADLDTTTKTLVTTMTAYYGSNLSAAAAMKNSTSLMNQMIETTSRGDLHMQDLASSLHSVTPIAAAAHISFAQVGGAIATMTAQGMSAQQATLDLGHVIGSLANPTNVQSTEMRALGLNANTVSKNLGKTGLAGTVNELRAAVLKNTSGGYVMLGYLKQMSPAAQDLANNILAGKITTGGLTQAMKGLNPQQAALVTHFKAAAVSATGLKQTYTAAMSKMLGGQTGLNVGLMLTGKHMDDVTKSTAAIAAAGKKASGTVDNWSTIQGTFNFKVAQAKTGIENTGIAIGTALLPAVTSLLSMVGKVLVPVAEWTAKHKTLTLVLFGGATALAALVATVALATKAFKAVKGAVDTVKTAVNGAVGLMKKLGGQSKATAEEQAKSAKAAASAEEKAAGESAAVQEEKAGEAAAAQEADAAEVAAANEEAAAESSGSWITGAAKTVAGWAKAGGGMIASAAKWVAQGAVKVLSYVAVNVLGAETASAAWLLASAAMLLGIGLVIAGVVFAVVEIVKHWKQITAAVAKVWDTVYDYVSKVIGDVIGFIKSHWVLIVSIITGPLGLAVIEIVKHWDQIKSFISGAVNAVINFVKSHWRLIISILGGPLGLAVALVTKYWNDIKHWFTEGVSTVLGIIRGLAHDVVSAGEDVVRGIWRGISGMGGWLWGQVKSFASNTLHSFESALGIGSPSKYTTVHGQMLGLGLAGGIISSLPKVAAAARLMSSTALAASSGLSSRGGSAGIGSSLAASAIGAAGAGGGASTIEIHVHAEGAHLMSDADLDRFVNKIGTQLAKKVLPAAGRKMNIRG